MAGFALIGSDWESGELVFRTKADGTEVFRITATGVSFPAAVTIGGIAYTFPADNGDSGEQLQTNGSGVLTWEASGV
jgi:hypothetical protein